jgi:hypothetical protein
MTLDCVLSPRLNPFRNGALSHSYHTRDGLRMGRNIRLGHDVQDEPLLCHSRLLSQSWTRDRVLSYDP